MNSKESIETTVEYLFTLKNERNIMLAFLLRTKLNWTPKQVSKLLRLSVNQVNQLNTARLFMLSSDKYHHVIFSAKHSVCEDACFKYTRKKFVEGIDKQNIITRNRLQKRINEYQN